MICEEGTTHVDYDPSPDAPKTCLYFYVMSPEDAQEWDVSVEFPELQVHPETWADMSKSERQGLCTELVSMLRWTAGEDGTIGLYMDIKGIDHDPDQSSWE